MIVAAAIKINSALVGEAIIAGTRHADCYEALYTLSPFFSESMRKDNKIIEGFITNDPYEKFVDRQRAYVIATTARQLPVSVIAMKKEKGETELYSEDLY